jgi:hypothetical protein
MTALAEIGPVPSMSHPGRLEPVAFTRPLSNSRARSAERGYARVDPAQGDRLDAGKTSEHNPTDPNLAQPTDPDAQRLMRIEWSSPTPRTL